MIRGILPGDVAVAERRDDDLGVALYPEEEAALGKAVEKRRREFATVRACAREALAEMGVAPRPIVPGARGEPRWPPGVVGSMTHCSGYRAAVVAPARRLAALGIDAEPHDRLPDGVLDAIATAGERVELAGLARRAGEVCWDRLLFSSKESVFKAWFPLTRRQLGFDEAVISIDPQRGRFSARLLVAGPVLDGEPLTGFSGRWLVRDGLVLTAITLPRGESA